MGPQLADYTAWLLQLMFNRQTEEQDDNTKKIVIGSSILAAFMGIFFFAILIGILLLPSIVGWFLPSSIKEVRDNYSYYVTPEKLATGHIGIYRLPTNVSRVSSYYGRRVVFGKPDFHEGIDFVAPFGDPVVTIFKGTVVETGVHKDYGQYIMIKHKGKKKINGTKTFYSFYAHLSKRYVFEGQKLEEGAIIGEVGGDPNLHFAGRSTGTHLHLEIRLDGSYASHVDPYDYVIREPDEDDYDNDDDDEEEDDEEDVNFKM